MSSAGKNDRISDYSLSPHRLHSNRMMGCASSQSGGIPGNPGHEKSQDGSSPADNELLAKYPPAEAFEISLDDVDNRDDENDRSDSLIKKHPPKRLQKLVEQAATAVPPTTIEHLEEKLAKAEVRRQQYIQKRIDNIITLTAKGGGGAGGGNDGAGSNQNDGQNDEHRDGGNAGVDGEAVIVTRSQDAVALDVVESTSNQTATSANEQHIQSDGDHDADNHRIHS